MIQLLCVDFQKDFTDPSGFAYKPRKSVDFVKNIIVPFLREHHLRVAEIISDYREIPLSSRGFFCEPGTSGYESEISDDVRLQNIWIKCLHSPVWTRDHIGDATKNPGKPRVDVAGFEAWLHSTIGKPGEVEYVALIGLTINCCILSVAQELFFRGFKVKIITEATDDYSGNDDSKEHAMALIQGNRWAEFVSWEDIKNTL